RHDAERAVVEQRINDDQAKADDAGDQAAAKLIRAERCGHRCRGLRDELERQRTELQHVGEVLRLLLGELTRDLRLTTGDAVLLAGRCGLYDAVKRDGDL